METESFKRQLLQKLVEGTITKSEYRQLELAAMDDPFLFEALEGYTMTKSNQITESIDNIHLRIDRLVHKDKKKRPLIYYMAAVVAGIAFTTIALLNYFKNENAPKYSTAIEQETSKPEIITHHQDAMAESIAPGRTLQRNHSVAVKNYKYKDSSNNYSKSADDLSSAEQIGNTKIDSSGLSQVIKEGLSDSSVVVAWTNMEEQDQNALTLTKSSTLPNIVMPERANQNNRIGGKRKIIGVVTDETGTPVIGANVMARNDGTITDRDGNFAIEVSDKEKILKVNYFGFEPIAVDLDDNKEKYIISLKDEALLDEVIVVGQQTSETNEDSSYREIKDRHEDWKKFNSKVHDAIKKELKKARYSDTFSATIDYIINDENKVTEIKIESSSDHKLDTVILKVLNKTKNKIPPTAKRNYRLNISL